MALTQKIAQLKGDFFLKNLTKGELVHTPMFNATTAAFNPSVTTEKIPSNGNDRGTVYSYESAREATLTITAHSRHAYMLNNYLLGTSVEKAAETDVEFALPALAAGQAFPLPAGNITAVTIPGLVEGVDYRVRKSGAIVAIVDLVAVPTGATFSHGVYSDHGVFNAEAQRFEILYISELSGTQYTFHNGLLVPSGELSLLAESGVGTAQVTFELSELTTAPDAAIFGRYGRVRSIPTQA